MIVSIVWEVFMNHDDMFGNHLTKVLECTKGRSTSSYVLFGQWRNKFVKYTWGIYYICIRDPSNVGQSRRFPNGSSKAVIEDQDNIEEEIHVTTFVRDAWWRAGFKCQNLFIVGSYEIVTWCTITKELAHYLNRITTKMHHT